MRDPSADLRYDSAENELAEVDIVIDFQYLGDFELVANTSGVSLGVFSAERICSRAFDFIGSTDFIS